MLKSKKLYIALTIIVIITTALIRFYRLNDNFLFDIDSEYQAFLAKTIIKHFHIIWIGVSAGSIGYYLGPGLVYLTAILLWPTRGDPISLAFFSAAVGAVTCLSIYFIGHNLYGKSVAMVSTIIYGFSAFIIRYNQRYWPIFIPLVALWIYYSLVKAEKNPRYLILAVVLFSLSFHIHLTLLIFGFFIVWQFVRLFRKIDLFTWAASISGYLFITFPLLIFDFVHKFDNLLMPLRFVTGLFKKRVIAGNFHLNFLLVNLDKIWYVDYMHCSFLG